MIYYVWTVSTLTTEIQNIDKIFCFTIIVYYIILKCNDTYYYMLLHVRSYICIYNVNDSKGDVFDKWR